MQMRHGSQGYRKKVYVNMGKTKFLVFETKLDLLKKSEKGHCAVNLRRMGRNAICAGCLLWVHK